MKTIQCTHPPSSSPQWLCSDMPAMDGHWRSSCIVTVLQKEGKYIIMCHETTSVLTRLLT